MEAINYISDKISSYNLFNNLFPGIIFCYIARMTTRISFAEGGILENLFIYYFVGMILSRIGSLLVEKGLKSLKVKDRTEKVRKPFVKFASYDKYTEASESCSFIKVLNETNNTYRTMIALFLALIAVKLYDCLLYDYVTSIGASAQSVIIVICFLIAVVLFALSYKKQTDYIRLQVEHYCEQKENK